MTRRDLLRLLLVSAVAEAVDVEKLLWVPKPIVTVPELPYHKVTAVVHRHTLLVQYWNGRQWLDVPPDTVEVDVQSSQDNGTLRLDYLHIKRDIGASLYRIAFEES